MTAILLKIIPVILIFVLGYVLKRTNLIKKEDGDRLLKIVFYIAMPALVLLTISNIKLSADLVYLPIIAAFIILITFVVAFSTSRLFCLEKSSQGVFLVGSMIMNTGFTFPFFIAAYGTEGFARISLFDFGNALLIFTFVYFIACKFGKNKQNNKIMVKKIVFSPPLWALLAGGVINLKCIPLPIILMDFLEMLGNLTMPLILLSLGIYFSPKIIKPVPLCAMIVIRMFFGLLLGVIFVKLFHLEGLNRLTVLIGSSAPVGYNTLTFSSLESLDKEFAASVVSISIFIGLFSVPLLMFFVT